MGGRVDVPLTPHTQAPVTHAHGHFGSQSLTSVNGAVFSGAPSVFSGPHLLALAVPGVPRLPCEVTPLLSVSDWPHENFKENYVETNRCEEDTWGG